MVDGKLNVILHGLLFLELKSVTASNCWLEITAPDLSSNHDLLMGVPGNLQNINFQPPVDWRTVANLQGGPPGQLVNGIPKDVPDQIFQFSRTTTAIGSIDRAHIQGKILLPWPAQWNTIRRGDIPALTTRLSSKPVGQQVHTDIERRCGSKIGVATVLSYIYPLNLPPIPGWSPTTNIAIHFQPQTRETITQVNADLAAASFQLFSSDNFDLAIVDTVGNSSTPIGQTPFPQNSGLSVGDELSPSEDVEVVDPATDPKLRDAILVIQEFLEQLQISTSSTNLNAQVGQPSVQYNGADQGAAVGHEPRPLNILQVSPANCPTLFLGG